MHALNFTITRTEDAAPRSTSIGAPRVQQSRQLTSGVTQSTVIVVTTVSIAIPGQSNSFTQRSTNPQNVTTFRTPAIVPVEHSVLLHILNVSSHNLVFTFFGSVTFLLNIVAT